MRKWPPEFFPYKDDSWHGCGQVCMYPCVKVYICIHSNRSKEARQYARPFTTRGVTSKWIPNGIKAVWQWKRPITKRPNFVEGLSHNFAVFAVKFSAFHCMTTWIPGHSYCDLHLCWHQTFDGRIGLAQISDVLSLMPNIILILHVPAVDNTGWNSINKRHKRLSSSPTG